MSQTSQRIIFWAPRLLAILYLAFISLFALDVFNHANSLRQTLTALAIHLIPTAIGALVLALAWRWEWLGAAIFALAAFLYAASNLNHPSWIAVISAPLLLVAGLFLLAWLHRPHPAR